MNPARILVVGVTGSGKTTVARALARRLGVPHIELDALFWSADWRERPTEEFRAGVAAATAQPAWVACGNYHSKTRDLTWERADLIVWLDISKPRGLWQLVVRTLGRIVRRERLWHGNRETFRNVFFKRDSLLVWWWQVQRLEPGRTRERLSSATQAKVVRLRDRRQIEAWLRSFPEGGQI